MALEGFSMNKLARACKISVATLYIYYKDRDDLIINIAFEERQIDSRRFDQKPSTRKPAFEDGLRIQWQNRYPVICAR
jgi:TetR/AcrR family transcriptional repressor of multidrug resistance operon